MWRAPLIVLSALALLLSTGRAVAEDEAASPPEPSRRRSAEIRAHTDQPEAHASWLRHHLDRVHFHEQTGFAYTQALSWSKHDLELSLRGPALGRKSLGLSLEIRF